MSNSSTPSISETEPLTVFWFLLAGVTLAAVTYAIALTQLIGQWQVRAEFGDMFGALNAVFSGLAFTALVYALVLQRRELALQRHELSLTRSELSKQASAQSQQAVTALRAAEISALGALLQSYAQLIASGHSHLVESGNYPAEVLRVKQELKRRLEAKNA